MCHEEAAVVTTAPSWHQVKDVVWREVGNAWMDSTFQLTASPPNKTELSIDSKRFAVGLSTDKKERFQGIHNEHVLVIVTEASGMPEEIMDAIETLVAGGDSRLLYIGNPTIRSGTFYEAFNEYSALYSQFHVRAFDTPNFTEGRVVRPYLILPTWVEEMRQKWGEGSPLWQVHIEGEFPDEDSTHLFPLGILEASLDIWIDDDIAPVRSLGVDVARKGVNKTVYTMISNNRIESQEEVMGSKTTQTAARTKAYHRMFGDDLQIAIDDSGSGGGVVDILEEDGYDVRPIIFGASANDNKRFANRGSEIYWELREAFETGQLSIPRDLPTRALLFEQLTKVTYMMDGKDRIIIAKKQKTAKSKNATHESPDLADSLVIAYAALSDESRSGEGFII